MSLRARLWSLSGLATELRRNVRTVARALQGVAPDGRIGKHAGWRLTTALRALAAYEAGSDQLADRRYSNGDRSELARVVDELEATTNRLDRAMQRTRREPDLAKRREQIAEWGPTVGAVHRLLRRSFELQEIPAIGAPFCDRVLGELAAEVLELGGWELHNEAA